MERVGSELIRLGGVMAKRASLIMGGVLLVISLLGVEAPEFLGIHWSSAHVALIVASAVVLVCAGFARSMQATRASCVVLGIGYLALALLGFLAPSMLAGVFGSPPPLDARGFVPDNGLHM